MAIYVDGWVSTVAWWVGGCKTVELRQCGVSKLEALLCDAAKQVWMVSAGRVVHGRIAGRINIGSHLHGCIGRLVRGQWKRLASHAINGYRNQLFGRNAANVCVNIERVIILSKSLRNMLD
jgi:hypothetical protein